MDDKNKSQMGPQTPAEKRRTIHTIAKVYQGITDAVERHDSITIESTVTELLEALNRDVMKEVLR